MKRLRSKLTYANVISTLCLILLVGGGTALAAGGLEKESVGTRQLKKEAVTPLKLSAKAKATLVGPTGPKGATGPTGPQGPKGAAGTNSVTNFVVLEGSGTGTKSVECNPGEHLTGGGAIDSGTGALKASYPNLGVQPNESANRWTAISSVGTDTVTVRILCATP